MERLKKGEENKMNENLAQLVQETPTEEIVFSENNLDIPAEEEIAEVTEPEIKAEEQPNTDKIQITSLASWFESNCQELENINQVKVSIRGVDPTDTLIMAVKDESGEQDESGNDKRNLRVFEGADTTPVLNLPPMAMNVYNNGFRIIYQYSENIFIKTYGVRTGLICVLCILVGEKLVPYNIIKVKKKDTELEILAEYPSLPDRKLSANANLESLQLLYKQSAKFIDTLSTNQSVIDWLSDRQESVTDINHHLQIDNVLIDILK